MIFLVLLLSLVLLLHLLAFFALFMDDEKATEPDNWPKISIWVAARNEENTIQSCLESLSHLDYPKEQLQILIGDDESSDRTAEISQRFIVDKPYFQYKAISGKLGCADKKANVLAHLAHHSDGEYYLICDADIQVKPSWAKELVKQFDANTGVVSGTTLIDGKNLFAKMQRIDWLYFMGLIKSAANLKIPCTAVGNNMAVSKEAYWATGGYENIAFSITEDFKLFREIIERGYGWKHLNNRESTSLSAAAPSLKTLLLQRKRWLEGGRELPHYWKLILALHASFNPAVLVLVFFWPLIALAFVVLRFGIQSLYVRRLFQRIDEASMSRYLLTYAGYTTLISSLSAWRFLLPSGKEWKGRKY